MTDVASLVREAQGGDGRAFGEIVARFYEMARAAALSRTGDRELSEDITQEAFLAAFLHLKKLKEPQAFPGWFRQIVLRQCSRMASGQSSCEVDVDDIESVPSPEPTPDEVMFQRERADRVRSAVESLPDRERTAVHLYYQEGLAMREVAQRMAVPETTVKKRLYSARERLRRAMLDRVCEPVTSPERVCGPVTAPERVSKRIGRRPANISGAGSL